MSGEQNAAPQPRPDSASAGGAAGSPAVPPAVAKSGAQADSGKEPPWASVYEVWRSMKRTGVPPVFILRPSVRKYTVNAVLLLVLVVAGVWGLLMPADGYGAWHWMAIVALGLTAVCHLLFIFASLANRRVLDKMKLLLGHLILFAACVVMFLMLYVFRAGGKQPGPVRSIVVYIIAATALVYLLYLVSLVLWRKVGVRFEVTMYSLVVRRGIFGRTEDETPLVRVNDIHVNRTFSQRLLGVCTVDIISTDSTDVDNTNDKQRRLLNLTATEGVLELFDMPKMLPAAKPGLVAELEEAAKAANVTLNMKYLETRETEESFQERMHWMRQHRMVVVDA